MCDICPLWFELQIQTWMRFIPVRDWNAKTQPDDRGCILTHLQSSLDGVLILFPPVCLAPDYSYFNHLNLVFASQPTSAHQIANSSSSSSLTRTSIWPLTTMSTHPHPSMPTMHIAYRTQVLPRPQPLFCKQIYPDDKMEGEIMSLNVRCSFYKDGCKWTDQLRTLQVSDHSG